VAGLYIDGRADEPGALVVVFLRGGADGLTLVPPVGDDDYHRLRPLLRVSAGEALPLDGLFGLHPGLAPLEPLWQEGQLTVVPAAGSDDDSRSHFEAQDLMEHGGRDVAGGWLGRWLRAVSGGEVRALSAVAFGTALPESLRGAPGVVVVRQLRELSLGPAARLREPLAALYEGDPLLGATARDTLQALDRLRGLASEPASPADEHGYGTDAFSATLRDVARLLRADVGLRAACVDLPGWDSHALQPALLEPLIRSLATGLAAFASDLGPRLHQTSVVVMTEFGRRVAENSALGTDHGRGGVMLALGGGTPGGIRGRWPGLDDEALEGPGDVPVVTDYREVLGEILARHAPDAPLENVFPPPGQGTGGLLEPRSAELLEP
jgi:uncharacterized protein (DUF1501 family)